MAEGVEPASSSSSPRTPSTTTTASGLNPLQTFLVIISCIAGQICVGSIFMFNFYVTYLVSYIKYRGCKYDMDHDDGSVVLLLISTGYGLFGYPAGCIGSVLSTVQSLTVGSGCFVLSLLCIFLGAHYSFGLCLAAFAMLGASACQIQMSLLLGCLKHFQSHRGIITGALFGVAFGAPAVLYIWEISYVNPKNIPLVMLVESHGIEEGYYDRYDVLDNCARFFVVFCVMCVVLLLLPLVMLSRFPPPLRCPATSQQPHASHTSEEFSVGCHAACISEFCGICLNTHFLLAFFSIGFAGVSGLCARSTLKSYGNTFLPNQHYLSKVGGSGSLACSVGSLAMGILLDLSFGGGQKLLILICFLNFVGTLMLMYAKKIGAIWYLLSYDIILFSYGGSNAILILVLLEICGLQRFPVAFGVTCLVNFFSATWYFLSVVSKLEFRDFWLACVLFAFMGVVSAFALQLKTDATPRRERQHSTISEEEDNDDFVVHNGKRYYRFSG